MATMDEIEVVLKKFGDEQSTLLDQFERMSFEVRLNQALLGRSLSEPSVHRNLTQPPAPPPHLVSQEKQARRRGSGFHKVLKKLLKPILRRSKGAKKEIPDPKDPSWCSWVESVAWKGRIVIRIGWMIEETDSHEEVAGIATGLKKL
ncbi:hypothetical protein F0562_017829 [Nyssa sinensis]|uniref:Uncharacterized protein n=1 Tax=Nyssa sinensis TaxID=561372 RepID=A0A5J4ZJZ7_9ASTE|nr:hypothetical protein F0562_017829 [Nyssa sinensis]